MAQLNAAHAQIALEGFSQVLRDAEEGPFNIENLFALVGSAPHESRNLMLSVVAGAMGVERSYLEAMLFQNPLTGGVSSPLVEGLRIEKGPDGELMLSVREPAAV